MPHPLDSFFAPGSIALIGASRDQEKIPGRLLSMLRKNGFPGKIYPVNPNYGDIDGLKCFSSIADVGQPIDLAIVIIPARAVLGALEQCAAAGVKNAVIISSGFAEEGGDSAAMQDAIAALAKRTGMRISGPNAEGFYSEVQRVAATFSPTVDVKPNEPRLIATRRRIGIVAQSGGIGFAIYHRARALGIALSYVISAGNESDLGAGEFFEYMVQDSSTEVILLFIEGIRDVEKFLDVANALDEQQNHFGGRILHHVFEKFAGAEVGFVAGADDVTERDAERAGAVIDRKADAAALRDDADPPPGRDQPRLIGLDIDGRAEGGGDALDFAVKSFRIGTGNSHPGPFRKRRDGILHRGAVAALLGKSRRDDHRVLDAGGGALLERAKNGPRRNDDDGEVDRLPDIGDRGKTFQAIDIAVIGIDRINLSRKSVLAQHRQQPARDFLLIARCADQRDAAGGEEAVERVRHSGWSFYCCLAQDSLFRHGRA